MTELFAEGAVFAVGARALLASRPLHLARPRRGSADLGDRDDTPGAKDPARRPRMQAALPREPWLAPAAWTAVAVTAGFAVRGALALM